VERTVAEINVTPEDVKQAEALQSALPGVRAQTPIDVCKTWGTLKPFWPWVIRVIKLIPSIGGAIAKALEFLGNALDTYCKTT
jgi:hypothetical protein